MLNSVELVRRRRTIPPLISMSFYVYVLISQSSGRRYISTRAGTPDPSRLERTKPSDTEFPSPKFLGETGGF
jgi:hypothetical protein